jgi:hypothetical protein
MAETKNVGVLTGCLIICGIIAVGIIGVMIMAATSPNPPDANYLVEKGDSFALVLHTNKLPCDRIVSITTGYNVRCSSGEQYKMWSEEYWGRDGAVERRQYRWHIQVID